MIIPRYPLLFNDYAIIVIISILVVLQKSLDSMEVGRRRSSCCGGTSRQAWRVRGRWSFHAVLSNHQFTSHIYIYIYGISPFLLSGCKRAHIYIIIIFIIIILFLLLLLFYRYICKYITIVSIYITIIYIYITIIYIYIYTYPRVN